MWYNKPMKWLLQSPFHALISGGILLLSYEGRKSGKQIATPVNYSLEDGVYRVVSSRERVWWRNFRAGAPATLLVKGVTLEVRGQVLESEQDVGEALSKVIQTSPGSARFYGISLDAEGNPDPDDVVREAARRVVVLFRPA